MSLLLEKKGTSAPLPQLDGKEVLTGPNPEICKVKGVMFGGRKQFLTDTIGEEGFAKVQSRVSTRTAQYLKTPLASAWCEFESLIELDRAIYESCKKQYPNVLALIGAASAAMGIGKVYRMLDTTELTRFLETNATFHSQYQKFGKVTFQKTAAGGRMVYSEYPCYSPVFCASAVGYFMESVYRHGCDSPDVKETKCQCLGDKNCTFEMSWR